MTLSSPFRIIVVACAVAAFMPRARADVFLALGKDTVVCYGEKAPKEEVAAAQMIAERCRAAGGPKDNLMTAEQLRKDSSRAAPGSEENSAGRLCWKSTPSCGFLKTPRACGGSPGVCAGWDAC